MIYGNIYNSLNSLSHCAYIKLFTRALQEPIVCSPDFRKYCPKRGEFLDRILLIQEVFMYYS